MKKPVYLILLVVVIFGVGWYVVKPFSLPVKPVEVVKPRVEQEEQVDEIKPLEFTEEQLESYYSSYSNPYVIHIRKALGGYLDGSNVGMDSPESVIEKGEINGTPTGLSSFDKDYYKSKFIVYAINNSIAGGKEIVIIFQDKPDKLFTAWVYKFGGEEEYDLRGFWQDLTYDEGKMAEIQQLYKNQLEDKEHAI